MASERTQDFTRDRLLQAAAEVFVEKGFKAATVRDICRRAQANVASVNYYFKDKQQLYLEVLRTCPRQQFEKYPLEEAVRQAATPEAKLDILIRTILRRMLDPNRPSLHQLLLAREMLEPTGALDEVFDEFMRPQMQTLVEVLLSLNEGRLEREKLGMCIESIIGQCVFHLHARHIIKKFHPKRVYDQAFIEELANHVVTFSLGGIRAILAAAWPKQDRLENQDVTLDQAVAEEPRGSVTEPPPVKQHDAEAGE